MSGILYNKEALEQLAREMAGKAIPLTHGVDGPVIGTASNARLYEPGTRLVFDAEVKSPPGFSAPETDLSGWASQRAAQAWCADETSDRVMDPPLAEAFADILKSELSPLGPLRRAIQTDQDYAWSWHCNIAACAMDEGVDYPTSQRIATRFMQLAFNARDYAPMTVSQGSEELGKRIGEEIGRKIDSQVMESVFGE